MFRHEIVSNLPEEFYDNQFNEMALALYHTKFGKIGYLKEPMSIYRVHESSLFSTREGNEKIKHMIRARELCYMFSPDEYKETIKAEIDRLNKRLK